MIFLNISRDDDEGGDMVSEPHMRMLKKSDLAKPIEYETRPGKYTAIFTWTCDGCGEDTSAGQSAVVAPGQWGLSIEPPPLPEGWKFSRWLLCPGQHYFEGQ